MAYSLSVREDQKAHSSRETERKKNHNIENIKGTGVQEVQAIGVDLQVFWMLSL